MYWAHHYWGMHLFWWIFWVIGLLAFLLWAVPTSRNDRRDLARETLRQRFAAGEITEEELRQRMAVLDENPRGSRKDANRPATRNPTTSSPSHGQAT